ncbi:uncharacterized protein LOC143453083 isoform X2 [Clavelina lepadiformis]|uniref:uncharacterized protein LOC143453083 isoform X2 n=1 Tax=Clavelina lepadiformis TaxID=159417 RepID=UPI004041C02B
MTLLTSMQAPYRGGFNRPQQSLFTSDFDSKHSDMVLQEQPVNQCENLEEVLNEITSELNQTEWSGVASCLRIDPDKLHLVVSANGCDLQRQKTLGLLCWVEDDAKSATFEKLITALHQVNAKNLASDVSNFSRLVQARKYHVTRRLESLHTQYYAMQLTQYPQVPRSPLHSGQWRFTEIPQPHFLHGSSSAAFYPSKSVPSNMNFDLTSSVSIQGSKVNLLHREMAAVKVHRQVHRPATIASMPTAGRKRALGGRKKSGGVEISTYIKTAVPLTSNMFRDCHPEEIEMKIAEKLFDYLLNGNGSRELLATVATLELIDGLVVKKLRRGSLKIETNLLRASTAKILWGHFESGELNLMLQDRLISETSLKMAGASSISLETSIDRNEMEHCLQQFQNHKSSFGAAANSKRSMLLGNRSLSPPRMRFSHKSAPRLASLATQGSIHQMRVTSVPASRSVTIDLTPSVTTVKPGPRGLAWRGERSRGQMKPSVVYDDSAEDVLSHDQVVMSESKDDQSAPPPSPDLNQEQSSNEKLLSEESIRVALDDLHKRTNEVEEDFKHFDEALMRKLVDALKKSSQLGVEKIQHMGDLRKFATILRQNDDADTALMVEEFVKVTESLDQIHRDVTSKIWLKVSENSSASAKSRDSSSGHRRSPLRNQVTQSIEIWRQMQEPKYNFTNLNADESLGKIFSDEELSEYGGLLSHIPALLASAKSCHQLLHHYMQAP